MTQLLEDPEALQPQLWLSKTSMIESSLPSGFSILAILNLGSAAVTNWTHSSFVLSCEFNMLNICKSMFLCQAVSLQYLKQKRRLSRMLVPCESLHEKRVMPWRHYHVIDNDDP